MRFVSIKLKGAYVVEIEPRQDERGFFARTFCSEEFARLGLVTTYAQCSVSYNERRGILRGMHYQADPKPETKLIRCTAGAVHDVLVDLRRDSETYCQWVAVRLDAASRRLLYVPAGLAHGFQVLEDGSEVYYEISTPYEPGLARGVRWDDPAFGIEWPIAGPQLSARDAAFEDFQR
ncbi:MAG: dTDP-4-dehydrorhamnose 3,5-epimerase [Candidatus Wallbacteria bacterium]|nr:dTDP-4-dehydrorhamnose 3,5-epimerase [Candidatus Wallbacteria bacterium]